MIKTLSKARKQERVKFLIPRSVQDCIPIRRIWADGIFQVGHQFSKTWSFTDINYSIAGKDDKTAMFLDYCDLLNALASGASAKITLYNRRINKEEFERSVLLPLKEDGLDNYREEFNEMLRAQVTESNNSIVRERYLTISVVKRNIEEARTYFARVGTDLTTKLAALSSVAQELSLNERLRIFRDFFRPADPPAAEFDIHQKARRGQHFKDWLCPSSMEFTADHFKIDDRVGRVLYLQDFASYLKGSFVSELCDLDRELMLSIDILPIPTDEAARQLQNTLLGVETNVTNWQRKQNANNNWSAIVPYDMELQRKETKEMLDDLTTRDQRMMFGLVTLVHMAGTKEQLDDDTESLLSVARKHLCQLSTLRWQQRDGLDTVLPYGLRRIDSFDHQHFASINAYADRAHIFISNDVIDTANQYIVHIDFYTYVCVTTCVVRRQNVGLECIIPTIKLKFCPCFLPRVKLIGYTVRCSVQITDGSHLLTSLAV